MKNAKRNNAQALKDLFTFPLRAVSLFYDDKWGLSSLLSERFYYVQKEVIGYCLDVGCGPYNRFINDYLKGNGIGVDVFPHEGLSDQNIINDVSRFPFDDGTFDSITFIANINHIPKSQRDIELAEAYRCLRSGGNVIVTMGNPIAEILMHKLVWAYDRFFGTNFDRDSKRGMSEEEEYYLEDSEIITRLARAGFRDLRKRRFVTQWGLNHLLIGWKR